MPEREPETLDFDEAAEPELVIGDISDYIDNNQYSDDDGLPDEIKPRRKRRSSKKTRETVEAISESIAMLNGMFAMMVPCSCAHTLPEGLAEIGAHRDTCAKTMPLNEGETESLSKAIAAEFNTHPEWADKLENSETWVAHLMLISAIGGIIISRRLRGGNVLFPPEIPPEEAQRIIAGVNGSHA